MKRGWLLLWGLGLLATLGAEETTYRVTNHYALRRWVDTTYQGFVYGSASGSWKLATQPDGTTRVTARYYLSQESRRDDTAFEKSIDTQKVATFTLGADGTMGPVSGDGVPPYRNYPGPLPPGAGPGTQWTGTGAVAGDFLADGRTTVVPILVAYQYLGPADLFGQAVVQVSAKYALRYRAGQDPSGDPGLSVLEGTRDAIISYDPAGTRLVLLRETVKEAAKGPDGKTIRHEGIAWTGFEVMPPLGTASLAQTFADRIAARPTNPAPPATTAPPTATSETTAAATTTSGSPPASVPPTPPPLLTEGAGTLKPDTTLPDVPDLGSPVPDVKVEADPRGVKLTLENLQFVADQATLLPGEDRRLAAIVKLLQSVPNRQLLVIGHTADVGSAASQEKLSLERAQAIVAKLKAAGVEPRRLMYQGKGGREPIAPNDTEAHKAQNRRVEILVLDQ